MAKVSWEGRRVRYLIPHYIRSQLETDGHAVDDALFLENIGNTSSALTDGQRPIFNRSSLSPNIYIDMIHQGTLILLQAW